MYSFPLINHLDDVYPHIVGHKEFIYIEKDDYNVIDYIYQTDDTFGKPGDAGSAYRRECRGLLFDKEGKLIRRAFQKFFNYGEKQECRDLEEGVDLLIQEKLDGSMVTPFNIPGKGIRWATRKGITDISMKAENFITNNLDKAYMPFAATCIHNGLTPIFEWLDPHNPIVVSHDKADLVLTAIRDIETGHYFEVSDDVLEKFNIPHVKYFATQGIHDFVEAAKKLQSAEGWVVTYPDGNYKFKLKGDWYVRLHGLIDKTSTPRKIVEILIHDGMDDIRPILVSYPELYTKVLAFEQLFWSQVEAHTASIFSALTDISWKGESKKDFAIRTADPAQFPPFWRGCIFHLFETQWTYQTVREEVLQGISNKLSTERSYEKLIEIGGLGDRFKTL